MADHEVGSDGSTTASHGGHGGHRNSTDYEARGAYSSVRPHNASELNGFTGAVVDEAFKLHTKLGHSLLETTYECILERALIRRGLSVERQVSCDFVYDGMLFRRAIRLDLLIENTVVVELKAEPANQRVHTRQLLTYLRLLNLPLGLLINFGVPHLKDGIHRLINVDST